MSRLSLRVLPSVLALGLTACAPTGQTDVSTNRVVTARQCVSPEHFSGFTVDDETLYVRGLGKSVYQVETAGYCPNLTSSLSLGFVPQPGDSQVCVGDWVTLATAGNSLGSGPCRARVVRSLTEAEVEALPAKTRP
ncbi:DUF6491 family protein [Brevundimonas vesicularis]|uniref:DUF6491 family protein n=1 Tax=Brevundimonas vesicularis TaxID=41276 RepID=UPI0038D5112B